MPEDSFFWNEFGRQAWRPVVAPHQPPLRTIRPKKSLPGQMLLPGMEVADETGGATDRHDESHAAAPPDDPGRVLAEVQEPGHMPVCPNCGGTTFDRDGDCTTCWEPGVVKPGIGHSQE